MSKSLAEMRSSARTGLPERSYSLCLSQPLMAEVEALNVEEQDIRAGMPRADPDEPKRPRRVAEGPPERLAEIAARKQELSDEMREHTGELRLRAVTGGQWRRWVDEHPARTEGTDPGGRPIISAVDNDVAYGYANAADLMDSLGDYAHAWNGDPLGAGDWDFIQSNAAPGDLKELCKIVVQMHEGQGARPFLPKPSSSTTGGEAGSN